MSDSKVIEIRSRDYWYKNLEFRGQDWALVEPAIDGVACTVYFVDDTSDVFDRIEFRSIAIAEYELGLNGFRRFATDIKAKSYLTSPQPRFIERSCSLGPIYSSGQFWRASTRAPQAGPAESSEALDLEPVMQDVAEQCVDCGRALVSARRDHEWTHCEYCGQAVCDGCDASHACEALRSNRPKKWL